MRREEGALRIEVNIPSPPTPLGKIGLNIVSKMIPKLKKKVQRQQFSSKDPPKFTDKINILFVFNFTSTPPPPPSFFPHWFLTYKLLFTQTYNP